MHPTVAQSHVAFGVRPRLARRAPSVRLAAKVRGRGGGVAHRRGHSAGRARGQVEVVAATASLPLRVPGGATGACVATTAATTARLSSLRRCGTAFLQALRGATLTPSAAGAAHLRRARAFGRVDEARGGRGPGRRSGGSGRGLDGVGRKVRRAVARGKGHLGRPDRVAIHRGAQLGESLVEAVGHRSIATAATGHRWELDAAGGGLGGVVRRRGHSEGRGSFEVGCGRSGRYAIECSIQQIFYSIPHVSDAVGIQDRHPGVSSH